MFGAVGAVDPIGVAVDSVGAVGSVAVDSVGVAVDMAVGVSVDSVGVTVDSVLRMTIDSVGVAVHAVGAGIGAHATLDLIQGRGDDGVLTLWRNEIVDDVLDEDSLALRQGKYLTRNTTKQHAWLAPQLLGSVSELGHPLVMAYVHGNIMGRENRGGR